MRCGSYSPRRGRNCPRCYRPCWIGRLRESSEKETMNIKNLFFLITITVILVMLIAACTAESTQVPPADAQVTNVTESELVTGQITQTKTFDQCDSSSVFRTEVQFSDSNTQTDQQGLVLGAEVTGGGKVSGAIELEIKGSIEKHFSETIQQGQTRGGSASIEVPPHTKQEYTIIWQEIRRNGVVEYEENGQKKSTEYSYRVGLELVSSFGRDIPCDMQNSSNSNQQTKLFTLDVRKPDPDEISTGLTSIWDDNNLEVKDIQSPGKKTYSGIARIGVEYIFPVFWCATTESILADNMDNMKTTFFLDEELIPATLTLVYGYKDSDGWRCINTSTMLGGWVSGGEYKLQAKQEFETSIFDGQTSYPAGSYIYELNISVR